MIKIIHSSFLFKRPSILSKEYYNYIKYDAYEDRKKPYRLFKGYWETVKLSFYILIVSVVFIPIGIYFEESVVAVIFLLLGIGGAGSMLVSLGLSFSSYLDYLKQKIAFENKIIKKVLTSTSYDEYTSS